jgi:hypothetical protein
MPGWQTLALYGAGALVAVAVVYIAFRMLRKEARKTGEDSEARKTLETVLEMDERLHELDGRPAPLSRPEQLRRLRALQARLPRRWRKKMPGNDEPSD